MGYLAVGDGKVLATAVDTMWRWQLQPDFDDPPFAMLLANAVRFLAPPPGRKKRTRLIAINATKPRISTLLVRSNLLNCLSMYGKPLLHC